MEDDKLKNLALKLFDIDAIKFGNFITKIGLETPIYVDLRVIISYPKIFREISETLWQLSGSNTKIDQICGVPYTALPIASLISADSNIPMLIKRKEAKSYGTKKLIEGKFNTGDNCIIIEDVITSGSSILETVKDLEAEGLKVTEALVVIDREQGGKLNIENNGIKVKSLFTLTQLMNYLLNDRKISKETVNKVTEYLLKCSPSMKLLINDLSLNRLKMDFLSRSKYSKNPLTRNLFEIMVAKNTNLCLAADLIDSESIIDLASIAGPHIAVLKIHVDIIEDFNQDFLKKLKDLSIKYNFKIMEDRKFGDIGQTVSLQLAKGVYKIAEWADLITVHPVGGPGSLEGINEALKNISANRGVFIVTEMSSKGALTDESYVKTALKLAENSDLVVGHVCQKNLFNDPGLIQLTPGVKLGRVSDELGQQYNTPETVVRSGADLAVVGRGITEATDKLKMVIKFKEQLWSAYQQRIKQI